MTNKKALSERDICTKFITPAIIDAGRDLYAQVREEVSFTKGRIIVRGKLHTRGGLILNQFLILGVSEHAFH
jgi:type I restriction enzyme R subunit